MRTDEQKLRAREGQVDIPSQLVVRSLDELHPHPSYVRHRLSVSASQLSTLATVNEVAFRDPIVITQDHTIIDGYARWELAKRRGRATILCIQRQMTDEEALETLISTLRNRLMQGLPERD